MTTTPRRFAYVAEGKLYLHDSGATTAAAEPTLVESPFVQSIFDRLERSRDRNAWKSQSAGWDLKGGGFMGMRGLGARQIAPSETRRILFTGVARGNHGHLVYSLDTDHAGGLFAMNPADQTERRLFHRQNLRARDVATSVADGALAVSLHKEDGTAHLAMMGAEGRGLKEITEGDAIDEAPSWVGGGNTTDRTLVFQSAGIGRNAAGAFVALSPYAVQQLDLASEKVTMLLEDDHFDYLSPRMPDGKTLYCIRRPYEPHGKPASALKVGLDVLLFPFRVLRALVHFLNFMSLMFARKPIMTAGGPPSEGPDQRFIMLWGRVIDAESALKKKQPDGALVPKDWELIRKTGETEEVLASGVAAYDVTPDGKVIWTNGTAIYERGADGKQELVYRGKMIERLAMLGS